MLPLPILLHSGRRKNNEEVAKIKPATPSKIFMSEPTPKEASKAKAQDQENLEIASDSDIEIKPEQNEIAILDPPAVGEKNEDDRDEEEESSMTVIEHLDELRMRVLRSISYLTVSFLVTLAFTKDIMRLLQKPAGDITFQALSIEEPVMVFFKVCFYTSLIVASPFVLFEISQFVAPGLTRKEKRIVTPVLIGGPVLFVSGAAFAYFLVLPPMLHFFQSFSVGVIPINQRLDFYMSLVSSVLLYMGLCFQLPIVLFALSFTGLVTSDYLIKIWRYVVVGAAVVAMVVTPDPTVVTMVMVLFALLSLYAVTVLLLKLFGR